jgi:hypothetical protein
VDGVTLTFLVVGAIGVLVLADAARREAAAKPMAGIDKMTVISTDGATPAAAAIADAAPES